MTNLKLPSLAFDALATGTRPRTIAYATTARPVLLDAQVLRVEVLHHSNLIAQVDRDHIVIDTCGWDSKTTAHRLDAVLRDNGIPYRVVIRQGSTCLVKHDDLRRVVIEGIESVRFTRREDGWHFDGGTLPTTVVGR